MAKRVYESIEEALANGKYDVAQQLLAAGKPLPSIAKYFYSDDDDRMLKADARAVIWLAKHGAACDVVASNGLTAIASAARHGSLETVEALLAAGASVGPGPAGNTPLHGSVDLEWCNDAIWDLLIEAGSPLEARNDDGETPLSLAQTEWNWMAIVNFAKHGAKHDVVVNGQTPLARAIEKKQPKVVKVLERLAKQTSSTGTANAPAPKATATAKATGKASAKASTARAKVSPASKAKTSTKPRR